MLSQQASGLDLVDGINDSETLFRRASANRSVPETQEDLAQGSHAVMKRFLTFCLLLFSASSSLANTLVLVSIDGFRWDYLDWPEAQNIKRMAEQGVRVNQLQAVYPSKTFPAHLSIATGLRPTDHGVVDNYFCRSDRPDCYRMGSGQKDPDWLAGTPLWTLVEQQGGRASTFFWPESDAKFDGILPTDYRSYDVSVSPSDKVRQATEWLSLPEVDRPDLVTLYFSKVDSSGHTYGPDAPETKAAIAETDYWVGQLWRAIQDINRRQDAEISLILLSDHGMSAVDPSLFIDTNTLPRPKGFRRVNSSTRVMYYRRDPKADVAALAATLREASNGRYRVVSDETLAERHYKNHPAVADLIIETDPPRLFRHGGAQGSDLRGMHGYPAEVEDMAAFLVAIGPGFSVGKVIPKAHQLDVYPIAATLLDLSLPDGIVSQGGTLRDALAQPIRE
ncbi:ectonucleotide pyrophosphatase/phosphodiesterase [Luminiphilus sp.]|nr:ectonucleotide pyrophosphatase/phosphodiesterase [Luminiphilus sp.]